MRGKILLLIMALVWCGMGCASGPVDHHAEEIVYQDGKLEKFTYSDDTYGAKGDAAPFLGAVDVLKKVDPLAIPELEGLPMPGLPKKNARAYTGIIKNRTKYDINIPSLNSDATLTVPAKGFIEYTAWKKHFEVTAYRDGKPFYCLKINATPREYAFMCKKYDFICEVVGPEPATGPSKLKPRKKRKVKREEPC
jgi:hypothetical protein